MLKKTRSIFSLPEIPDTILALVLIYGIGSVFGLLLYGSFEMNKARTLAPKESITKIDDYFGNQFIKIMSPQKNTAIDNPVLIAGKANVFEANVRIRMKDEMQNILLDTFITAEGAYDKLYPFENTIDYISPSSKYIVMEIFEENAKDGTDMNKVIIPLVFKNYVDISNWRSYADNEYGYEIKYPDNWEPSNNASSSKYVLSEFNFVQTPSYPMQSTPHFRISVINKNDFANFSGIKKMPETNFSLNSYPAFKEPYDTNSGSESYLLEKNINIMTIKAFYDEKRDSEESKLIRDKILSTFKFIEK
jgi:hypothetical protein